MTRIDLMICVNDPDNGCDTERVDGIDVESEGTDQLLELRGQPLVCRTFQDPGGKVVQLQIGRLKMPVYGYGSWVGNWCWDCARVDLADAVRVINYVQRRGWDCEAGWTSLYEAFAEGKEFSVEQLQKALNDPNGDAD